MKYIIFICVIIIFIILSTRKEKFVDGLPTTYYTCKETPLTKTNKNIFDNLRLTLIDDKNEADIFVPCGYTTVEAQYKSLKPNPDQYIFAVKGSDSFVSKSGLWALLVKKYGKNTASSIMPKSWLLHDVSDCLDFMKEPKSKIYILKKNIQRQEGLLLKQKSDLSIFDLNKYRNENYVIIQKFIDNPFTISQRKINIRVYFLLVCDFSGILGSTPAVTGHIYDDGFVYYTKNPYKYSTNFDETITSGYIDRDVYAKNPLTQKDLRTYLGVSKSNKLFANIENTMKMTAESFVDTILNSEKKGRLNFQLFGVDFQINKDLTVYLIEINKGPSLTEMDGRDTELKLKLQNDVYHMVKIAPSLPPNGFKCIFQKSI